LYSKIKNPKTGMNVNINSKLGKSIIKNYLKEINSITGKPRWHAARGGRPSGHGRELCYVPQLNFSVKDRDTNEWRTQYWHGTAQCNSGKLNDRDQGPLNACQKRDMGLEMMNFSQLLKASNPPARFRYETCNTERNFKYDQPWYNSLKLDHNVRMCDPARSNGNKGYSVKSGEQYLNKTQNNSGDLYTGRGNPGPERSPTGEGRVSEALRIIAFHGLEKIDEWGYNIFNIDLKPADFISILMSYDEEQQLTMIRYYLNFLRNMEVRDRVQFIADFLQRQEGIEEERITLKLHTLMNYLGITAEILQPHLPDNVEPLLRQLPDEADLTLENLVYVQEARTGEFDELDPDSLEY
jgi:hypothetical protein